MSNPHVLAIAYPAQGHVLPLMELVLCLSKHGVKITFVNTESIHKRVINAFSVEDHVGVINFVSIPDGMEPWEDRSDLGRMTETMTQVMPGKLEELIEQKKGIDNDEITCIVADENMGWALEVAEKMGIKRAAFWPAAAATLGMLLRIQELIQSKILDSDDRIICNTTSELEQGALSSFPEILPIGPLMASNRLGKSAGHLWPVDTTCITWLDQQPSCSVIYAAFGSFTLFDLNQLQELALGLKQTNRPFLWVVRPDMTNEKIKMYLEEFEARIQKRGRIVSWAPQDKVLSHPSVSCFLSHCGWNSTMEGVSNGVPFLCWPYFTDQFINQNYICDVWKVGLGLNKTESGMITREEISNKVEQLLSNKSFRERVLLFKEKATNSVQKGGCSYKNMSSFVKWISSGH
ncbi:hypothetical protein AgCh_012355 [Apium graveolens]